MENRPSALAAHASKSHTHTSTDCRSFLYLRISSSNGETCHPGPGRISRDFWMLLWGSRDFSRCKVSLGVSGRLRCLLPRRPSSAQRYTQIGPLLLQKPQHWTALQLQPLYSFLLCPLRLRLFTLFCITFNTKLVQGDCENLSLARILWVMFWRILWVVFWGILWVIFWGILWVIFWGWFHEVWQEAQRKLIISGRPAPEVEVSSWLLRNIPQLLACNCFVQFIQNMPLT